MISISDSILKKTCQKHVIIISEILNVKIEVLKLCLDYYNLHTKKSKNDFDYKLKQIIGDQSVKKQAVNWFLKKSTNSTKTKQGIQRTIKSIANTDNFFNLKFRKFSGSQNTIKALNEQLNYFTKTKINSFLGEKPKLLLDEYNNYKLVFSVKQNKTITKEVNRLILFLFDYYEFSKKNSSIYSKSWGAYKLTEELSISTCLYCNRNYTLTVTNCGKKIIRPELDHFFPQSIYPLLGLSFYNLIPSCHICNSNLKGKTPFNLNDFFHPYLSSFEKENAKFTYEPNNPKAFFGDKRGLKIKIDSTNLRNLDNQIKGNIEIFKLDYLYNENKDIVDGLIHLQRKTNKKKITDIFKNVLKNSAGKHLMSSEKEVYELALRNHFSPSEFHKKPLAKFERDIAKELGLIK